MELERQAAQITMVLINYCKKFYLSVMNMTKELEAGLRKFQLCLKKVLLSDIESRMKGA